MNEYHHHCDEVEAKANKTQTLASSLSKPSASFRGIPSDKDFHFFNNFDDFKNPLYCESSLFLNHSLQHQSQKPKAMASTEPEHEHREEEEAPANDDEDTGAQVAPIVKLEEIAVTTGEEDETSILDLKAKLYRFDKDGNQWKERGAGSVKFLKHKESGKVRLVMRQSKTLKICANHLLLPTMTVQEHAGNEKSCVWHATDFADGELKDELFCIRFASIENNKTFMETFQEVAESQKNKEENKDASATAAILEKLSVEEKKIEEEEEVPVGSEKETKSDAEKTEKKDEEPASSA
nr:ran-binding protein 1 like b [Quercus suber]